MGRKKLGKLFKPDPRTRGGIKGVIILKGDPEAVHRGIPENNEIDYCGQHQKIEPSVPDYIPAQLPPVFMPAEHGFFCHDAQYNHSLSSIFRTKYLHEFLIDIAIPHFNAPLNLVNCRKNERRSQGIKNPIGLSIYDNRFTIIVYKILIL
jgi:hypothetical protein